MAIEETEAKHSRPHFFTNQIWKETNTKFEINVLCEMENFNFLSPYLSELDICKTPVWNIEFDELDFFPSLNSIFLPTVAS
jgi:hypothetical protein